MILSTIQMSALLFLLALILYCDDPTQRQKAFAGLCVLAVFFTGIGMFIFNFVGEILWRL